MNHGTKLHVHLVPPLFGTYLPLKCNLNPRAQLVLQTSIFQYSYKYQYTLQYTGKKQKDINRNKMTEAEREFTRKKKAMIQNIQKLQDRN